MKRFLQQTLLFLTLPALFILAVAWLVPATPRASRSVLFSKIDKDARLAATASPRLILVGGSNLSFGIDSRQLEDSLGVHPVNTGLHASLGLIYMLDTALPYLQPGDTVVVAPEYQHFYGRHAFGGEELLRTVMDVDRGSAITLDAQQWRNILAYLPRYALSKLKPSEYLGLREPARMSVYDRRACNEYGDVHVHWNRQREAFHPLGAIEGEFNQRVVERLVEFQAAANERGAEVYITFPGLQDISYDHGSQQIARVERELANHGFQLLGTAERYRMPDQLMFNTPYHLNKAGVDRRTQLLIADLRQASSQHAE